MLLLFSLFASACLATTKPGYACYAKNDRKDVTGCTMTPPDWCVKSDKCNYGPDQYRPTRIMDEKYTKCMGDAGVAVGKACTKDDDCAPGCGNLCLDGNQCLGCGDLSTKAECNSARDKGLTCSWSGGDEMGTCTRDAVCYGKEPKFHHGCRIRGYDTQRCLENNSICEFGYDPYKRQKDAYYKCAVEAKTMAKACTTDAECSSSCSTGQKCLHKMCMGCADAGVESDCNAMAADLHCVWTGFMGEGQCIADESKLKQPTPAPVTVDPTVKPTDSPIVDTVEPTSKPTKVPVTPTAHPTSKPTKMPVTPTAHPTERDACLDLSEKQCKKSEDCDMQEDECRMNYTPECFGRKVDVHNRCVKTRAGDLITTKKMCESIKPPFGPATCIWGKNTIDMDAPIIACMKKNKVSIGKGCVEDSDCECGNKCFTGVCGTCRDMGTRDSCNELSMDHGNCKWVGGDSDGVCMQVDMCRDFSLDEKACNDQPTCGFKDSKCAMLVADKKVCKKRGKNKQMSNEDRQKDCEALKGCKFQVKKGGKKVKCKFDKKRKD